jgi:hypothetical protein
MATKLGSFAAALMAALLLFLWTWPKDADTMKARFFVTAQDGSGAYMFDFPLYVISESGDTLRRTWPGSPDSSWITLPCRSVAVDWAASCTVFDTTNVNESGPSNVIRFTYPGTP